MSCNNRCDSFSRNEFRFEERDFEEFNFEGRNSRRGCRCLANDVERLIRDIRRDANRLSREFDRLEDRGCIRNTRNSWSDSDDWGGCGSCNRCNRCNN